MKLMTQRKGFTLIEILIVVAIIGILASVVLVGLGPTQKRARDTRRISDLRNIQTGLELYYNANGKYPAAGTGNTVPRTALLTVTSNIPHDPSNSTKEYTYATDVGQTSYVLEADLEVSGNPAFNDSPSPSPIPGVTCDHINHYCVQL